MRELRGSPKDNETNRQTIRTGVARISATPVFFATQTVGGCHHGGLTARSRPIGGLCTETDSRQNPVDTLGDGSRRGSRVLLFAVVKLSSRLYAGTEKPLRHPVRRLTPTKRFRLADPASCYFYRFSTVHFSSFPCSLPALQNDHDKEFSLTVPGIENTW